MDWKIVMADECWDYWWALVDVAPGEVGCWGYVTLDKENREAFVSELFIVPQTASAAEVDFMEEGLPFAIERAAKDDKLDQLRFCIHSHGKMDVFYSNTDEDMIAKMGRTTDWFVSAITNKAGKTNGRIDLFNVEPLGTQIKMDKLDFCCERQVVAATEASHDFAKYVSKPQPKTYTPTKSSQPYKYENYTKPAAKTGSVTLTKPDGTKLVTDKPLPQWTDDELEAIGHWRFFYDGYEMIVNELGQTVYDEEVSWSDLQSQRDIIDSTADEILLSQVELAELAAWGGWSE